MTLKSRVSPFGNLRIKVCSQLPEAYRSVLRPSSPLNAKASTKRPFHTLLNSQTFFIQKSRKFRLNIKYYLDINKKYSQFKKRSDLKHVGGGGRDRTDDLKLAKLPLSQLSYAPKQLWWAREDLNLRPHAYQACALTNWATSPFGKLQIKECEGGDWS